MKFEHTLSPAAVEMFRAGVEQLNASRLEYLRALGLAKEAEMQTASVQQTLSDQVKIIQRTDNLPQPIRPYVLNADCTKLVGEIPDPAPAAELQPAIVEPAEPVIAKVNGAAGADHA